MTTDTDKSTSGDSQPLTHDNRPMSETDPATKSRRGWWILGAVTLIAGAAVYGLIAASGGNGNEAGETTAALNTAEVVRTDLVDETTYQATLGRPEAAQLTAGLSGTVTSVPEAGTVIDPGDSLFSIDDSPVLLLDGEVPAYRDLQLGDTDVTLPAGVSGVVTWLPAEGAIFENGSVIARINEAPIVVLQGDIPMYRTLRDGVEGPDVQQLEQALVELGYDPDEDVTVDEEFTSVTESMVERWQEDLGIDETGRIAVGEVIFAPLPGQVLSYQTAVGAGVGPASPLLIVSGGSALSGPDVLQLEQALLLFGYEPGPIDGVYDLDTALAVAAWTGDIGHGQDGRLPVGSIVFHPGTLTSADILAPVGSAVGPSSPVITAAALETIVRMSLPAADQELLSVGTSVIIVMPDQTETPGTVTFVSTVAVGGGQGNPATFDVEIALDDPSAAAGLDEAPVDVRAVTETVEDVLAVPVSALLALAEGGYAVELVEGGSTRLVAVDPGFFAGGQVEVTGDLEAGDIVATP